MPSRPICAVYLLSNRSRVLSVGVTSDLAGRAASHRRRHRRGTRLVYFEPVSGMRAAMERKLVLEAMNQHQRWELMAASNPEWRDLMPAVSGGRLLAGLR